MTATLPSSARGFAYKALVEGKIGQLRDAIASYSRALQLDSSRPETLLGLARAQYAGGMKKEGIESFETGLRKFPQDARFKVQYAAILLKEAETGDVHAETHAENLLKAALSSKQTLPDAHYQLGNLALRKGRIDEAIRHLETAEKLEPQSSEIHFALSRGYRRMGRKDMADQEMELYQKLTQAPQSGASQSDNRELPK
jgi:tetratricopeptide (TPR) repeat protein